jgi:RimJ/RimL family protein N-acetyltransferase
MPDLQTPRLNLRPFRAADADFAMALLNDPAWLRNIGDRGVRTSQQARDYIDKLNAMHVRHGHGAYLVELKHAGTPIGLAGLFRREGLDDADIGFALLPEYTGHGYALEAARAVLQEGRDRLGLRRVSGITLPANRSSIKLLEHLGLKFVESIRLPNSTEDLSLYAIDLKVE